MNPASGNRATPLTVNAGQLWARGVATAVVAALIAVVGILIARGVADVAVLAPSSSGTWADASTTEYALAAFVAGLAATAIIYLLLVATPAPFMFFGWIMALATVVGAVLPFTTNGLLSAQLTTAVINAVIGVAIWSLIDEAGRRSLVPDLR